MRVKVSTQAQLDAAIQDANTTVIEIRGGADEWLSLRLDGREIRVEAWENSRVVAWENSSVEAWENSRVEAWENSSVEAWENSRVEAWENSRVVAWGNSSVVAWENSSVVAWGNSSVVAWGNSSVEARENSRVEARENSSVEARHTARLAVFGSGKVRAAPLVSVHIFSQDAQVDGGHQIIVPPIHTIREWASFHGLEIVDGTLTVYKAVGHDLKSPHGALYAIGSEVVAPDWDASDCCGYGLHFSATPREARGYFREATRYLACAVREAEAVVIGQGQQGQDKIKARRCTVLYEVDIDGERLLPPEPARKRGKKAVAQ